MRREIHRRMSWQPYWHSNTCQRNGNQRGYWQTAWNTLRCQAYIMPRSIGKRSGAYFPSPMSICISRYNSSLGILLLGSFDDRLVLCDWASRRNSAEFIASVARRLKTGIDWKKTPVMIMAKSQLDEYFQGRRISFDIPLLFTGTDFQTDVWSAISEIPYGSTQSYSEIAFRSRHPEAVRAVANAIGANRLSIIIPCHRVTGINSIGGYAGGISVKESLLSIER